jgi:hypothetical protein
MVHGYTHSQAARCGEAFREKEAVEKRKPDFRTKN